MQIELGVTLSYGELAGGDVARQRVQRNTRTTEPEWPDAVQCPDGCGALVWAVGDEQGRTVLLDTVPIEPGKGGYAVEPLYVGPSADVAAPKADTVKEGAKDFAEVADGWNWYGMYESTLVSSSNSRFGLHVLTCGCKTKKQRERATNGQTYGGCCVPKSERTSAISPRV